MRGLKGLESHPRLRFNMWCLLNEVTSVSIAGSVGAGRPGNAGLPTGARSVPAHPEAGPRSLRGS